MAQVVVANGRGVALSREGEGYEWGPYASGTRPLDLPHDSDLPPTMIFAGVSLEARAPQPLSAARALVVAMGLHARLGAASPHRGLTNDALQRVVSACKDVESVSERARRVEWD